MPRQPDTRQRIERAAIGLFATKGIAATTTKDIAAAVGISEGAIYRHFRSKEELAWQLFSGSYAELARQIDSVLEATGGFAQRIERIVALFCALFDRDPELFAFILLSQHGHLRRVEDGTPSPVDSLRGMFDAAIRAGECRVADADTAAALALGLVVQPATFMIYGRLKPPMATLAPLLTEAVGRVMLADPGPPSNGSRS